MKGIHPFPARMAPEIALKYLDRLPEKSFVVDPMAGSGTVLRAAALKGHRAAGYDMDPLAVLMASAWTSRVAVRRFESVGDEILIRSRRKKKRPSALPWVKQSPETRRFIKYWFANEQANDLASLAHSIHFSRTLAEDVDLKAIMSVALSRLIVTKQRGASLAWDVSHSRPHKVRDANDFDVFSEMELSLNAVAKILCADRASGRVTVRTGDGRQMKEVKDQSADLVLTSPPYLNAIDYLRGHRLSLVWLGYSLEQIREIRGESIGVERSLADVPDHTQAERIKAILKGWRGLKHLDSRYSGIIKRYASDALGIAEEIARVLKPSGSAVLVLADSRTQGVYVRNSEFYRRAAEIHGLKCQRVSRRQLPLKNRYLPVPLDKDNSLHHRMKSEVIMEFVRG